MLEWASAGGGGNKSKIKESHMCFNKEVINTLVDGILFEPTNEKPAVNLYMSGKKDAWSNFTYLGDSAPRLLNSYLSEFASPCTAIEDGASVQVL